MEKVCEQRTRIWLEQSGMRWDEREWHWFAVALQ